MAELATIARPYAEALFKSCGSDAESTAQWLDTLAAVAGNPQLLQYAGNPKVGDAEVFDLITSVARTPLPDSGRNFLRMLIENGRLSALPAIAGHFHALVNARRGSSDAIVYSAFPIDAQALAGVSATLERRFGRKLNLAVQLEPALIGGIRVVVGDEVLDTSVKARLEQMKVALSA
jgi:F-type H+-transporting ATPase subunit delta